MCRTVIALTLGWLAVATLPASAQHAQLLTGGVNRTQIINTPIDVSRFAGTAPATKQFNISSFFPSFNLPSWPAKTGASPLPAPSSFPSTHYESVFKPMAPFTPSN